MKIILAFFFVLATQMAHAEWNNTFSAQMPNGEFLTGIRCQGGEKSSASERWCKEGQWLLAIGEQGPIIVKLKKVSTRAPENFAYFEIIPKDFINYKQRRTVGRYWVRFDLEGETSIGLSYFHYSI